MGCWNPPKSGRPQTEENLPIEAQAKKESGRVLSAGSDFGSPQRK
ncbi:hypothetical protein CRG98_048878, partial [Punica granatum]